MANSYSSLDEQLAILHGQVTQALMLTKFSCTEGTREVIEAVVHRTRTKVRMLGGVPDSSLAMMAVQETRSGLAQLPEISAATEANASLMQQLLQDEATKKVKERSISTRTQMGGEISSSQEQNENATDSSSVMSTITGGIAANHGRNEEGNETESTATSKYCSRVAEEVMQPLKQLVEEAKKCPQESENDSDFRKILHARENRPSNIKVSKQVDFEQCSSPAFRRMEDQTASPRRHGACFAYRLDGAGEPKKVAPIDPGVDQFSPMSPLLSSARKGRNSFEPTVTEKDNQAPSHESQQPILQSNTHDNGREEGVDTFAGHSQQGSTSASKNFPVHDREGKNSLSSAKCAEAAHCDASIPPGLNLMGVVEGGQNYSRSEDSGVYQDETDTANPSIEDISGRLGELCRSEI